MRVAGPLPPPLFCPPEPNERGEERGKPPWLVGALRRRGGSCNVGGHTHEFVKGERGSRRKSPCSPPRTALLILIHDDDDVDKDDGGDAVTANLRDVPPRSGEKKKKKKGQFPRYDWDCHCFSSSPPLKKIIFTGITTRRPHCGNHANVRFAERCGPV